MKKLLVTLLLAAGLVTVASAGPLDCNNDPSNQCCIDSKNMMEAIAGSTANPRTITTTDKYTLMHLDYNLTNDATDGQNCKDPAIYYINVFFQPTAIFQWQPGDWADTIKWYSN